MSRQNRYKISTLFFSAFFFIFLYSLTITHAPHTKNKAGIDYTQQ